VNHWSELYIMWLYRNSITYTRTPRCQGRQVFQRNKPMLFFVQPSAAFDSRTELQSENKEVNYWVECTFISS